MTDDLHTTAMERYTYGEERDRKNREDAYDDLRFRSGETWPADIEEARRREGRPCLNIPIIGQYVRQVTGDIRKMRPSVKVAAVDDRGDPETADILAGLFRYIESRSSAQSVYFKAADSQVACGVGAWRVTTEYADDTTFNQEIRITSIEDPVSIIWDPDAVEQDRSDAQWVFVPVDMSTAAFRARYPDKSPADFGDGDERSYGGATDWYGEDYIRVAEYWYREPIKRTLLVMPDGSVDDLTDFDGADPDWTAQVEMGMARGAVVEERDSTRVMRAIISGAEVLEGPTEWPGRLIPIIPVWGEEIRIGRRIVRHGLVRHIKDPQRRYNYMVSAETEVLALQPKAPFIGTEKNFARHQDWWATANTAAYSYLPYDPDPDNGGSAPTRAMPPVASQGILEGIQRAASDVQAVTGIYNASLGAASNEKSGRAIEARKVEGDTGTYHYIDNFALGIKRTGQVVLDLIPHIYDTERTIRIVGEDGKMATARINQPGGIVEGDAAPRYMHDVTVGAYDVVMDMGPSYGTRRQEAVDGMTAFLQSAPNAAPVVLDLIAKGQDWPQADEIGKRLEVMLPAPIKALLAKERGEPPQPDPAQAAQAQAQQQAAQVEAQKQQVEMAKLRLEAEKIALEREKLAIEAQKIQAELAMARMQVGHNLAGPVANAAGANATISALALKPAHHPPEMQGPPMAPAPGPDQPPPSGGFFNGQS